MRCHFPSFVHSFLKPKKIETDPVISEAPRNTECPSQRHSGVKDLRLRDSICTTYPQPLIQIYTAHYAVEHEHRPIIYRQVATRMELDWLV